MSTPPRSLASRHSELTQRLILDSAVALLDTIPVGELTVRAIAKHAGISERTIFRYFATREDLLDALAAEISRRLNKPPPPTNVEELMAYPEAIYSRFEASTNLTQVALHSELYHRIRNMDLDRRGVAIQALIDRLAPKSPEHERLLATANIRYYLIATTWHYYRFYFGFSLEETVECAKLAIGQSLKSLGVTLP
ncbi:MAG: TetR/AcrR family transcriptional regulator [Gammaproteobacteria bacterium]